MIEPAGPGRSIGAATLATDKAPLATVLNIFPNQPEVFPPTVISEEACFVSAANKQLVRGTTQTSGRIVMSTRERLHRIVDIARLGLAAAKNREMVRARTGCLRSK